MSSYIPHPGTPAIKTLIPISDSIDLHPQWPSLWTRFWTGLWPHWWPRWRSNYAFLVASALLVSVPVFFQAPLVRVAPGFSLSITAFWLLVSLVLWSYPRCKLWGDLCMGFTWTWLAGSLYWGWLRWEPLLHLPVEAIGLPFALIGLSRGWNKVGHWFYLGSLFGTAITDVYFYRVDLIPYWRQLMQVDLTLDPRLAEPIFQTAVSQMQTLQGAAWAIVLLTVLMVVGSIPLRWPQPHWWAFGGAVLSTIVVDGLFWLVAISV